MSIIPPPESGMQFGPFQESRFIPWEKSNLRNACGDGFKCVEYICLDNNDDNCYQLIEAKKTAPNPAGPKGQEGLDEYINSIQNKFVDSTEMFFAHLLKFHTDQEKEIPSPFQVGTKEKARLKYILVVKESRPDWLRPIKDALTKALIRQRKVWNAKIAVLSADDAASEGLIQILEYSY